MKTTTFHANYAVCGLEELDRLALDPVTHVLSIIDPDQAYPVALAPFPEDRKATLRFHDIIQEWPGYLPPERADVERLVAFGAVMEAHGADATRHLLVHCHMGVSRSTAAMATLIAVQHPRETEEDVFEHLLAIRPQAWPNSRMIAFADDILGREGRMVAALSRLYARQIKARPDLALFMRRIAREREVEMGLAAA